MSQELESTIAVPAETSPKAKKPGKPKATKTKPNKSTKRVSALDAAFTVLRGRKQPMNVKDLIEAMATRKLWKSPGGATPHATLAAALIGEISKKGKQSRFKKVSPGQFTAS